MAGPRLFLSMFVLMLAVITLSEALRGAGPKKCCFSFKEKAVAKERVVSYMKTSQRCPKSAIVFKTAPGELICARPSASWVKDLISYLDNKAIPGETSNL